MKLQFFSVDALEPDTDQETIDDFCTRHRLVSVDKRFVERGEFCYWSVCVTYLEPSSSPIKPTKAVDKRGQVDYREILGAEDFAVYAKLRDLRKTISEAENAPVYAIFSNAQMADMVTTLPPIFEDIPAGYQNDVFPLLAMNDQELLQESRRVFPLERWQNYESLLEQKKIGQLLSDDEQALQALKREADVLTFRRSYAAVLLKRRG